jgi:hypothetical protein
MSIVDEDLEDLRTKGIIALHYPAKKGEKYPPASDNESLDPDDYPKKEAKLIRRFNELAANGGYVCATYRTSLQALIGMVRPGSRVKLMRFKWSDDPNRTAVLKTIQVPRFRPLDTAQHAIVSVGRPRMGCFSRWPRAGNAVARMVEGKPVEADVTDLVPHRLETLCSEFLRTKHTSGFELPTLKFLLMPVGRTMRDVDILGVGIDGRKILAQVTMHNLGQGAKKLERLREARGSSEEHLVMFCDCEHPQQQDGVSIFPVRKVFKLLRSSNEFEHFF